MKLKKNLFFSPKNLQGFVDTLVKKAYDNWTHVVEYDGKSLLSFKQDKSSYVSQIEAPMPSHDYSNSFAQQFTLPTLPVPLPSEQPPIDSGICIGGKFLYMFQRKH